MRHSFLLFALAPLAVMAGACGERPLGSRHASDAGDASVSDADARPDVPGPDLARDNTAGPALDAAASEANQRLDAPTVDGSHDGVADASTADRPVEIPDTSTIDAAARLDTASPRLDAGPDVAPDRPTDTAADRVLAEDSARDALPDVAPIDAAPRARPPQLVAWEPAVTPDAGAPARITFITREKSSAATVWVGFSNGDIWRTPHGTETTPDWAKMDDFKAPGGGGFQMPSLPVSALVVSPKNSMQVWTGFAGADNVGHKVWQTATGGSTWTEVFGSPTEDVRSLASNPLDLQVLYAVTTTRQFRSTDGGQTWQWWTPDARDPHGNGTNTTAVAFDFGSERIWTGDRAGAIWISNTPDPTIADSPRTWAPAGAGTPARMVNHLSVLIDEAGEHLAAAYESQAADGVWLSDDGGKTWHNGHGTGLPSAAVIYSVTINPRYRTTLYALTSAGPFRSDDGGKNWW